jgi:hypothetical protein
MAESHQELFSSILPDLSVKYERGKLKQKALGFFTRKTKVISRLAPKTVSEVNDLLSGLNINSHASNSTNSLLPESTKTGKMAISSSQEDIEAVETKEEASRENSESERHRKLSTHSSNSDQFVKIRVYADEMCQFLGVVDILPHQTASILAEIMMHQFDSELTGFLFEIVDESGNKIGPNVLASDIPETVSLVLHVAEKATKSGLHDPLTTTVRLSKEDNIPEIKIETVDEPEKATRESQFGVSGPGFLSPADKGDSVVDPKFASRYRTFSVQAESRKQQSNKCGAFSNCKYFPANPEDATEEQTTFGMPILPSESKTSAFGQHWHSECFLCADCGASLLGKKAFCENDELYCVTDYMAKTTKLLSPDRLTRTNKF